jgi:transcriptional pleiotropic regulator of transition state genes
MFRRIPMKSTGIVRRIDDLGRIVLPIEIRKNLSLASKDAVEIFVNEDTIVLKKYEPSCIFCGSIEDTKLYKGKLVCEKCLNDLKKNR